LPGGKFYFIGECDVTKVTKPRFLKDELTGKVENVLVYRAKRYVDAQVTKDRGENNCFDIGSDIR